MRQVIWKYPLALEHEQTITMPENAMVLTVQTQGEVPCIWALVNPMNPVVPRRFKIHGTGHELEPGEKVGMYIGSFQLQEGIFVGHLFDISL